MGRASRYHLLLAILIVLAGASARLFEWKMVAPDKGVLCKIKEGSVVGIPEHLLANPQENFFRTEVDGMMQVNYVLSYRAGTMKGARLVAGTVVAVHLVTVGGKQKASYTIELSNDGMVREVLLYGNIPVTGVNDGVYCVGVGATPVNEQLKPQGSLHSTTLSNKEKTLVQKSIVETAEDDKSDREFGTSQFQALALAEEGIGGDRTVPKPKAPTPDKPVTEAEDSHDGLRDMDDVTAGEEVFESNEFTVNTGTPYMKGKPILEYAVQKNALEPHFLANAQLQAATLVPESRPQFTFAVLGALRHAKKATNRLNLAIVNKGTTPFEIEGVEITAGDRKEMVEKCIMANPVIKEGSSRILYKRKSDPKTKVACPPIRYENEVTIEFTIRKGNVRFTQRANLERMPGAGYFLYFVVLDTVPPIDGMAGDAVEEDPLVKEQCTGTSIEACLQHPEDGCSWCENMLERNCMKADVATSDYCFETMEAKAASDARRLCQQHSSIESCVEQEGCWWCLEKDPHPCVSSEGREELSESVRNKCTREKEEQSSPRTLEQPTEMPTRSVVASDFALAKSATEDKEDSHTTPKPESHEAAESATEPTRHLAESEVESIKAEPPTCSSNGKVCAASGKWSADVSIRGARFSYTESIPWLVQTDTRVGRTAAAAKARVGISQMSSYASGLVGSSAFKKVMVDLKVNPFKQRDSVALADKTVVWTIDKGTHSDGVLVAGCANERVLVLPRIHEGSAEAAYYDISLSGGEASKVWIDLERGESAVCPCCPKE